MNQAEQDRRRDLWLVPLSIVMPTSPTITKAEKRSKKAKDKK